MMKKRIILSSLFLVAVGFVLSKALAHARSTDVTVDTSELGPISLNEKTNMPEEKPIFYKDENTVVGINEDGDPSLGTRF